ncbi:MAG: OmpA family protein [Rhizomicrobium sp.]|nr:OmpA family protein [Rhizomicrobium sp.]
MKRILFAVVAVLLAGCASERQAPPPPPVSTPTPPPPVVRAPLPPIHPAGPLSKAAVEVYMDGQEADLRSYMRGQGVLVARRGNDIALTVPSDKLFNKTVITTWGDAFSRALVQVIGHYDHSTIEILCYTDATGSDADNLALSQTRAKTFADGLVAYGIAAARLTPKGLGAVNPRSTTPNDTKNRRIEIKITPRPS